MNYKAPANVSAKTKKYIASVVEYLEESGLDHAIDSLALDEMAVYYDSFQKYSDVILKEGSINKDFRGEWKEHPLTKRMHEIQIQLFKIQQDYGLTLRSRTKISGLDQPEGEDSPLEKFLNRDKK